MCAVAAAVASALAGPAVASASQDPNPPWPELLPPAPISDSTQPGPVPHCKRPSMACIDDTISRLRGAVARFGCDHRGVFATTYLVLSEQLRTEMRRNPHLFGDPHYLETEDSVFANYYFDMLARQARGQPIPGAWQVAMDAAAHKDDNAGQDMLLGINAHVQRDMPYVVASVGLRHGDGSTRKPDHDRMNDVLNDAYQPVVDAIQRRFDPIVSITNASWDPLDDIGGMEMVKGWREGVWRNAERLVSARTPAQRAQVELSIETNATAWAHMMADAQTPGYRSYRDAYCRAGGAGAAPAPALPQLPALPRKR